MPYLFTCPHCQTRTEVEDRYSGQAGQCVTCGGEIQLPDFSDRSTATSSPSTASGSLKWVVAALVTLILIGCFVFAAIRFGGATIQKLNAGRERGSSIKNLEKIAQALNAYAADHGSYPPPYTVADDGTPLHSWRVLILPYLGEEELYDQFDLNVAWNDPTNTRAANDMPSVYRHPSGNSLFSESAYYLITGPQTLFPGTGPEGPNEVVDDPAQTILVIEATPLMASGTSGTWIEPIDLKISKMSGQINANPGTDPGGLLEGGVAMATVDGRGHFLSETTDSETLQALITPAGGERLADDILD